MKEIRLHGRGGQGVAMAAEMLAAAFVQEGLYSTAFPMFGFERRGAPVTAFVRYDDKPISLRTQIYEPDALIIFDPFLKGSAAVFQGLRPQALLTLNAPGLSPERLHPHLDKVGLIDGTEVALQEIGRPVTNTCMLGAFARASGWLSIDSVLSSLQTYFDGALRQKNLKSAARGFEETRLIYY